MKSPFPILPLLLLALAPFTRGAVPSPGGYFGGGPLSRSVQNEANAAIDNGAIWLADRQAPDGSWGDGDVRLTALCAIALFSSWDQDRSGRPATLPRCKRAVAWLRSPEAAAALARLKGDAGLSARGWREMALCAFTDGAEPVDPVLLRPLPVTNAPLDRALLVEWPLTEARCFRAIPTIRPDSTNADAIVRFVSDLQRGTVAPARQGDLADDLARAWADPDASRPWTERADAAWWLARIVNRSLHGEIRLPPGRDGRAETFDWRRELAEKWISSQRIDTAGHGHWGEGTPETTAFAILLLGEL